MTTQTFETAAAPSFGELTATVGRVLAGIRAGIMAGARASADWQRLNALTDAELARRGVSRERIARTVLERNFR